MEKGRREREREGGEGTRGCVIVTINTKWQRRMPKTSTAERQANGKTDIA